MPYISDLKHEMYLSLNKVLLIDLDLGKEVFEKVNAYCDDLEKRLSDASKTISKN